MFGPDRTYPSPPFGIDIEPGRTVIVRGSEFESVTEYDPDRFVVIFADGRSDRRIVGIETNAVRTGPDNEPFGVIDAGVSYVVADYTADPVTVIDRFAGYPDAAEYADSENENYGRPDDDDADGESGDV